jgi:hypothetical protein
MMRAAFVAAAVGLCACASAPVRQPVTAEVATSSPEPAPGAFDREAPPRIEAPTFVLELVAPASASTAEPTPISITLEGRGGFHVNLEYPLRLELGGGEGVVLSETTLAAADARELSEDRARFETQARWSGAGPRWLAARVQFAVCTPDSCVPREEALAITIDVQ